MVSLNKIMVIGNVGTEPDMRYTPSGAPVTSFRLATNRVYNTAEGERREETEWFTIVAWSRLAEQCSQFLSKGRRAYVEGRFRSRTWTGQDGQPRVANEIIAERVLFLDRPSEGGASRGTEGDDAAGDPSRMSPDDLPF